MTHSVTHARQDDDDPTAMINAMQRIVAELQVTLYETATIRRHAKDALRTTRLALKRLRGAPATTSQTH